MKKTERIAPLVALTGMMCGCCCDKVATTEPHIVAKITDCARYEALNPHFGKAFAFLRRPDLANLKPGRYEIDGDNCWATISDVSLTPLAGAKVEAHRQYIDIQAPISGSETIGLLTMDAVHRALPFDEEHDCVLFNAATKPVTLNPGEFAIFFPPDGAHAPGHSSKGERMIRKVVIKVKVEEENTEEQIVNIPESAAFTAMAWVDASAGSSVENPYPRIFELPFGRLVLVNCEGFADAGNVLFELPHSSDPNDFSRWTYTTAVPFGRWAHVALICRGADEGRPELYVNGKRTKSCQTAKRLVRTFAGGDAVIGNASIGGKSPLMGRVTDFRFEPRVLSPDELASVAVTTPDGAPPVDWRFEGHDELPLVDISGEVSRQTVIASGADGVYQGHPTTAVAPDGTVYCVWTIGHGGGCGPMAKSVDGGRTWTQCDGIMPVEYRAKHFNCPTFQRIVRRDGGTNLVVFSSVTGGCGIVISEDSGWTWRMAPDAKLPAMMPPTGLVMLKDGSAALFGQVRKQGTLPGDTAVSDQAIWMSVSTDGGWTWGEPRIVAEAKDRNLCEPFAFRSPDGNELCLLIRDNRHNGRSMMSFSRDEGRTWTEPADTCWGLTGDRHEGVRLPDGRLFIAFRDRAIGSSTYGQYVAWVGSYADLRAGRPGDFRVHLLKHVGERIWDTGYSGVECLTDGAVLCTTYLHYRESDRAHSVVSTRFSLDELISHTKKGTFK